MDQKIIYLFVAAILGAFFKFLFFFPKKRLEIRGAKRPILIVVAYRGGTLTPDGEVQYELSFDNLGENFVSEYKIFFHDRELYSGGNVGKGNLFTRIVFSPNYTEKDLVNVNGNLEIPYPVKIIYKDFHNNWFISECQIIFGYIPQNEKPRYVASGKILHFWAKWWLQYKKMI